VLRLSGGSFHNLALLTAGTVKAWGFNDVGQLGVGPVGSRRSTPVALAGLGDGT
jgi:alpha-tubulin suppressor-like RCC1 family protein